MTDRRFYAYVHRKADTGQVFYVGKGCGRRATSKQRNGYWKVLAKKHGHCVQIVASGLTESQALWHERVLILMYRSINVPLANLTDGGEGSSGHVDSEETRRRKSESAKGRRMSAEAIAKSAAFHRGRKRSPETLARISAALKGMKQPPRDEAYRRKLSIALTGRTISDAARAAMSAANKGKPKKPQSPEHRAKIAAARRQYWASRKAAETA